MRSSSWYSGVACELKMTVDVTPNMIINVACHFRRVTCSPCRSGASNKFHTSDSAASGASKVCGAMPKATKSSNEPRATKIKPQSHVGLRNGLGLFVHGGSASRTALPILSFCILLSAYFCRFMPSELVMEKKMEMPTPKIQRLNNTAHLKHSGKCDQ